MDVGAPAVPADLIVRNALPHVIIVPPSARFTRDGAFLNGLASIVRSSRLANGRALRMTCPSVNSVATTCRHSAPFEQTVTARKPLPG
jgi:hypothetical protein